MTTPTKTDKARCTIRIDAEDFEYCKKIFARQGYNAGLRWLISTFVKISKAKEAQHAKLPGLPRPNSEDVLREIGLDQPGRPDGEGPPSSEG